MPRGRSSPRGARWRLAGGRSASRPAGLTVRAAGWAAGSFFASSVQAPGEPPAAVGPVEDEAEDPTTQVDGPAPGRLDAPDLRRALRVSGLHRTGPAVGAENRLHPARLPPRAGLHPLRDHRMDL